MYLGIQSWGGINKPAAVVAIIYFISLVVIGNCIFFQMCRVAAIFEISIKNFTSERFF